MHGLKLERDCNVKSCQKTFHERFWLWDQNKQEFWPENSLLVWNRRWKKYFGFPEFRFFENQGYGQEHCFWPTTSLESKSRQPKQCIPKRHFEDPILIVALLCVSVFP